MNSPQAVGRNNVLFFALSIALVIGLLGASGFMLTKVLSGDSKGLTAATKACLSTMRTNGFNPLQSGDRITININTNQNIENLVYQSGVILASCPTYELVTYCAGTGCTTPGISMTMKEKK